MSVKVQEAVKDARLRTILHKYLVANGQEESYAFLFEKADNKTLYTKYISETAPRQVNIPYSLRKLLDAQAKTSSWDAMDANMQKAKTSIVSMLNLDVMPRFSVSEEYEGYVRSKDNGPAAKVALALKLKTDKANQLTGLMKVYNDARTPVDKYLAYEAMAKVAGSETKLAAAFKTAAVAAPPPVLKGSPDKGQKEFARLTKVKDPKVQATVLTLLKKYNSASLRSARERVLEELIKVVSKHSLNGRETVTYILRVGGWQK